MATAQATPTSSYKSYGPVAVIETSGTLSKIRTQTDDEFWVPTSKLKVTRPRCACKPKNIGGILSNHFKNGDFEPLLLHIVSTGALVVEVTPETVESFSLEYEECTKEKPPTLGDCTFYLVENPQRWGNEYRVTFPEPSFPLPNIGQDYQSCYAGGPGRLTINSKELFWQMVDFGMRLGAL